MPVQCSVIIPTYNRSDLLNMTLQSLAAQSFSVSEFEVIVIDDGSSDDTEFVARSYQNKINIKYSFQHDEGYRVAKARNTGIRNASSDICIFIDSGVILHSGCIAAHVKIHGLSDRSTAVCGYVYGFNEDNEDEQTIREYLTEMPYDLAIKNFENQEKFLDIREEFYQKYTDDFGGLPAPWLVFWTCNASARRSALIEVSMFDESFKSWGAEDIDLAYRLHVNGTRFVLGRTAKSIHYPHHKSYQTNMSDAKKNYQYFSKKYEKRVCSLVPDNHFFRINDIILNNPEYYIKQSQDGYQYL